MFYLPQNAGQVDLSQYDYVVDCIDTVAAKLELVTRCTALQVRIVSAMGSGNKLDPTAFEDSDLSQDPRAVPWPGSCGRSCAGGGSPT